MGGLAITCDLLICIDNSHNENDTDLHNKGVFKKHILPLNMFPKLFFSLPYFDEADVEDWDILQFHIVGLYQ